MVFHPSSNSSNSLMKQATHIAIYIVKSAQSILKKFRNSPPSLILHLHSTHFRFDQQDGSFSYTSPMKAILEHIKTQTIPHDMMEELIGAGVRFYEGQFTRYLLEVITMLIVSYRMPYRSDSGSYKHLSRFFIGSE